MKYKSRKNEEEKYRALRARPSRSRFSLSKPYTLNPKTFPRGFSIVETIVSIAILSIVIVAPLSLAQRGLNASSYARDQVTAFFLAQEAIEYVRNIRDNNNLTGKSQSADWLFGLDKCINKQCGIDVTANSFNQQTINCSTDKGHCLLTFNSLTGIYGERRDSGNGNPLPGWQNSPFTRTLQITKREIGADVNAEADLVATVSWQSGKIQKSLTVNEKIFDWYPAPSL